MNFLLHHHLATRARGSTVAGQGAMLPDLWRMADRRVRARHDAELPDDAELLPVERELHQGIAHHIEADHWFHGSEVFVAGERRLSERFRQAEFVAPRMGLLAHITWELCLDGALIRKLGLPAVLASVREGHDQAGDEVPWRAAARHHFDRVERSETERELFLGRMRLIQERLLDGGWLGAYADADGLVDVMGGLRRRLALPSLGERDRIALRRVLAAIEPHADEDVARVLAEAP